MENFHSILGQRPEDVPSSGPDEAPECFGDLNLDQIVAGVTAGKEEYDLLPFFYQPLRDVDSVVFRQEVMRDLEENAVLLDALRDFAETMRSIRRHLAATEKRYYERQNERWFLDAATLYCDAVERLDRDLSISRCESRGLRGFRDYVSECASSEGFVHLAARTRQLREELLTIRYSLFIKGLYVEVSRGSGGSDYSKEIEAAFERFKQGDVDKYSFNFSDSPDMSQVEGRILELVSQIHEETFTKLADFKTKHEGFQDPILVGFDRQIQFYIAYLEHCSKFKDLGLCFCYPAVSSSEKAICNVQGFDLALAQNLIREEAIPVCNDFNLSGAERVVVISGPNQGGKTTFARMFGQLHYLASLGCPVPGTKAQLFLADNIFTHFEKQEHLSDLRGKLEDDLVRIRDILGAATTQSIIIINEIFSSTALRDAVALSKNIAERIIKLDSICAWVTFIEEVSAMSEKTVSMVGTVEPQDPAKRTFKIVRQPAGGLAYAMSIAEKHRLRQEQIEERLKT